MINPEKILVRGPNWTGDLVMATPAFRALRHAFPKARLTLAVRRELLPLMSGAPWFDESIGLAGRGPLMRQGWKLRSRHFDLGICMPDSLSSVLHMRAAGVRHIVGYRTQGRGPLLEVAVEPPRRGGRKQLIARERHALGLVAAVGAGRDDTRLELHTTADEEAGADRLLRCRGSDSRPLAALAPGASYGPSKLWPAEYFAAVGDALAEAGAQVVLLGSPSEAALTRRVAGAMAQPPLDLTGGLDLGTLKAVIRRSRLLVCNDAGARHVAVAFGVPCVVLMGPTSLEKTNLNLERVRVLTADVGCRPCYLRTCPVDHRCMTHLDPARVTEAALPALRPEAGSRAPRAGGS